MISKSLAFCSSRISRARNSQTAVSMKSERFFLDSLARLSTSLSRSCDSVIEVLTFILQIYPKSAWMSTRRKQQSERVVQQQPRHAPAFERRAGKLAVDLSV